MPDETICEERDANDKPVRRCEGTTFVQRVGRVYWLEPRNFWEWIFGRKVTFWQCAKCHEKFKEKPDGRCNAQIIIPRTDLISEISTYSW